ncbi:unnamed protein product [Psylliodes chrysocephalus]|uniref:Uncharacterized protein n=1 Tax=Psylliodes chrysocephalus TaxID=3402493 RepID=A0A9P0D0U7_9CUCU|nr:unnamed protein product [Psylliodes chrysocephala]
MSSVPEILRTEIPTKISPVGKFFIGVTGGIAFGLTIICAPFVSPALRKYCLPYIPATNEQIANILTALKGRRGTLLDLGSGDGRIVIEAAKHDFNSHGVELNPWLVLFSKFSAFREGAASRVKFYRKDLWKFNISQYDNIVIFGVEQMIILKYFLLKHRFLVLKNKWHNKNVSVDWCGTWALKYKITQ